MHLILIGVVAGLTFLAAKAVTDPIIKWYGEKRKKEEEDYRKLMDELEEMNKKRKEEEDGKKGEE